MIAPYLLLCLRIRCIDDRLPALDELGLLLLVLWQLLLLPGRLQGSRLGDLVQLCLRVPIAKGVELVVAVLLAFEQSL